MNQIETEIKLKEFYKLIKTYSFQEASEKAGELMKCGSFDGHGKQIIGVLIDIASKFNEDRKHKEAIETVKIINQFKDYIKDKKTENIILNELELAEGRIKLLSKPRFLQVVLTTMCNLDCIMCGLPQAYYVMPDSIKESITGYMPYLESVIWQGGEPLLYKGFKDLFKTAGLYGIEQTVTTNGLLVDEEILEIIENTQGMIHLDISIDGIDEATYAKIRRKGNFNALLKKIDLINKTITKKKSFMLGMQSVVMKSNYKQIDRMVEFAIEKGFSKILFQRLFPSYLAKDEGLNDEENNFAVSKINEYRERFEKQQMIINIDSNIEYVNKESACAEIHKDESQVCEKQIDLSLHDTNKNNDIFCLAPWKRMFIGRENIVMPVCHCDVDGIKVDDVGDLWNGKGMIDFRKRLLEGRLPEQCVTFCKTSGDCFERIRKTGK